MIGLLFSLFINILDFCILDYFFKCFGTKKKNPKCLRVLLLLLCAIILTLVNLIRTPVINLITVCVLIYLYSLTFSFTFLYHIALPIIYIGVMFVTEPIGLLLVRSMQGYVPPEVAYNISVILCELLRALMSYAICKAWCMSLPSLSRNLYILMCMIPVSSILASCIAIYIAWIYDTSLANRLCLAVILIILFSNAVTFTIFYKLGILTLENKRNALLLHEAKAKDEYYHEVEKNNRHIQEIKHNLKNRILGVIAEGNNKLIDELESILGDLEQSNKKIYTSNIIFNTILKNKLNDYFDSLQIKTEVSILVPKSMNLEYSDAGILLGNLLDNAIEACAKLPQPERWIRIAINYGNHILILKITNSKETKPATLNQSSKADYYNHGFGTNSVRKIAEKYNGEVEFIDEGNWFEASVILYGIKNDDDFGNVDTIFSQPE